MGKRRRIPKSERECHACRKIFPFVWWCRKCDFMLCQPCMDENQWGLTCNNIHWTCPDCGNKVGYGNQ